VVEDLKIEENVENVENADEQGPPEKESVDAISSSISVLNIFKF